MTRDFPEFLKEFQNDLERYRLDCVQIKAIPIEKDVSAGIKGSKFSGTPYLPVGIEYPKDKNNVPMLFLAQLNLEEIPVLQGYPEKGILQFFVTTQWMDLGINDDADTGQVKVLYHENVDDEYQNDFSFLTEELIMESPIIGEHKLEFEEKVEFGGVEDFRFDYLFNGKPWLDYINSLNESQQAEFYSFFDTIGHKMDGYSYFTQSDHRAYKSANSGDIAILQIDMDENIIIGDAGVLHFFINKVDLHKRNFQNVYFQWDCC